MYFAQGSEIAGASLVILFHSLFSYPISISVFPFLSLFVVLVTRADSWYAASFHFNDMFL